MSRKQRFIENLTVSQKSALEKGYTTGKSHLFRRKCHCILLSHERKPVGELSDFFGVSAISIYSWLNQWEAKGIEGLQLKAGRGRPRKLALEDKATLAKVKELVENEPQNLNRVVGQIQANLGIELSKKTLQRFLKKRGMFGNASVKG